MFSGSFKLRWCKRALWAAPVHKTWTWNHEMWTVVCPACEISI